MFVREEQLFSKNMSAELTYTTAKNLRDGLIVQVREQEELVESMAQKMQRPASEGTPGSDAETALAAAIQVQEEKLRLTEAQLGWVSLHAPIDGVVIDVRRRVGEIGGRRRADPARRRDRIGPADRLCASTVEL